jgi:UDP-3-O-[3-hydroxymyristoyl] glucosamine N-acyltransferase
MNCISSTRKTSGKTDVIEKKFSLRDLASLLDCELKGDESAKIASPATPSAAGPEDGVFFKEKPSRIEQEKCGAGIMIVPSGSEIIEGRNYLLSGDMNSTFVKFLGLFDEPEYVPGKNEPPISAQAKLGKDVHVAAGVTILPGAKIGDSTVLSHGCYIGRNAVIGKNCVLQPNVVIGDRTIIGDDVLVKPGAVIGSKGFRYEQKDGRHIAVPQVGRVRIGDRTHIGANATIDRATVGETLIGQDVIIDNLVHIAHNCTVGQGSIIVAQVGLSGSVNLGRNVILAGQVGIADHLTVGDNSILAAQSGLTRNVPANEVWFGYPARPSMRTKRIEVIVNRLPELASRLDQIEKKLSEKNHE